jgi:acyl carrier protein
MEQRLAKVFKDAFNVNELNDDMALGELKQWDSFGHVNLISHLEKEFGVKISLAKAQELTSVKEIKNFLEI